MVLLKTDEDDNILFPASGAGFPQTNGGNLEQDVGNGVNQTRNF